MARIIPSDLTRLALAGAHGPEIATLAHLREALPEDYTVYHGVHWTRQYRGHTCYGEIDFVVLNRAGQVLCIEQKNGPLEESQGELFKTYGDSRKSVGAQILRSIDGIRDKLAYQLGPTAQPAIEYLIYCPDHALRRLAAPGIDPERVIDAPSRERLAARIQSILPPRTPEPGGWSERIEAFFRQTFEVVPDVHAHIDAQERGYTRASQGLTEVLDNIQMEPLRLRVLATAGNGKTLVARHFFDRCAARGGRPLLLCFKRPLAERLRHLVGPGGRVETWYGFCDQYLQFRGIRLDFSTLRGDPDFWTGCLRQVEDEAIRAGPAEDWTFATLIVDEAQDFEGDWFDVAGLFLRDGADGLWLEDLRQNLRGSPVPDLQAQGFVGYRSMLKCRSPERLARFIAVALPETPFTGANDLPRLGAGVSTYNAALGVRSDLARRHASPCRPTRGRRMPAAPDPPLATSISQALRLRSPGRARCQRSVSSWGS